MLGASGCSESLCYRHSSILFRRNESYSAILLTHPAGVLQALRMCSLGVPFSQSPAAPACRSGTSLLHLRSRRTELQHAEDDPVGREGGQRARHEGYGHGQDEDLAAPARVRQVAPHVGCHDDTWRQHRTILL